MLPSLLYLGSFSFVTVFGQLRPPNFSPDRLPETAFSCEDKVTGGYYADVEAHCQLFHVCVQVSDYEFQDFHFLCPNDTVFDQQHLVCTNWFEVDCHAQIELVPLQFFTADFGFRSEVHRTQDQRTDQRGRTREDQDIRINNHGHTNNVEHGFRQTGLGKLDVDRQEDELASGKSAINVTPIPLGFTTTIRPPGKPSATLGFLSGRNLRLPPSSASSSSSAALEEGEEETFPFDAPSPGFSQFRQDGRKPKVKSNLKANFRNLGHKKLISGTDRAARNQFAGFREPSVNPRRQRVRVQEPLDELAEEPVTEPYTLPLNATVEDVAVKPDGREARVKANLLADLINKPETTTTPSFLEAFFASPSSPQPFIFRGSPLPDPFADEDRDEDDLVVAASTAQPFFVPTVKSPSFTGITKAPLTLSLSNAFTDSSEPSLDDAVAENINDMEEETTDPEDTPNPPTNRFRSRPNPSRFNKRRRGPNSPSPAAVPTTENHFTDSDNTESDLQTEPEAAVNQPSPVTRRPFKHLVKKEEEEISENSLASEEECGNPFRCPSASQGLFAGKHRPRVKSNIRAEKRNYWQDAKAPVLQEEAGLDGRNRKLRRGRKQRVIPANLIQAEEESRAEKEELMAEKVELMAEKEESKVEKEESMSGENEKDPEDESQPTIPSTRQEADLEETSVSILKEEEDIFEDVFEQNDLIVASSTVSSVVFRGSPTPAAFGFFSSPGYDQESGVFLASPRPRFTNIGNDIDLGPKKVLSPNNLVFVTSTQSNKIFIGSADETSPGQSGTSEKRPFPSFPIRGAISFPFRPKPSLATPRPTEVTTTSPAEESEESTTLETSELSETDDSDDVTERSESTETTDSATTRSASTVADSTETTKFNPFNRSAKRRFNSLFNRDKVDLSSDAASSSISSAVSTTPFAPSTDELTSTPAKLVTQPAADLSTKRKFPFNVRQSIAGFKPFRGNSLSSGLQSGAREVAEVGKDQEPETTTAASAGESETERATESSLLSVESVLQEDSEVDNEILDKADKDEVAEKVAEQSETVQRFAGVKKARKPPPNANIRVEFKKAPNPEDQSLRNFFVKPDGRAPRVKSNIRAGLANKGIAPLVDSDSFPAGFKHGNKVEDLEFNGDPELENVDNTEKRAIPSAELNLVADLQRDTRDSKETRTEKNEDEFVRDPVSSTQPVLHSQTGNLQNVGPAFYNVENSPSIFQPKPLTLNIRPSNPASALLEQIIVREGMEAEQAEPVDSYPDPSNPSSLSAFQALLSQSRGGFSNSPLMLNPRDLSVL